MEFPDGCQYCASAFFLRRRFNVDALLDKPLDAPRAVSHKSVHQIALCELARDFGNSPSEGFCRFVHSQVSYMEGPAGQCGVPARTRVGGRVQEHHATAQVGSLAGSNGAGKARPDDDQVVLSILVLHV
jgi:hypothetical protein